MPSAINKAFLYKKVPLNGAQQLKFETGKEDEGKENVEEKRMLRGIRN